MSFLSLNCGGGIQMCKSLDLVAGIFTGRREYARDTDRGEKSYGPLKVSFVI